MNAATAIINTVAAVLFCLFPFLGYMFLALFFHKKIGDWYVGKVKSLDRKDLSVFFGRTMLYPAMAMAVLLLFVIGYIIFRPTFIDPTWFCFIFAGTIGFILMFQLFQYLWLYYHARAEKEKKL